MLRTHTCGELRLAHVGVVVTLCGWVHKVRNKGALIWVDLRDRYGITQLVFEEGVATPEIVAHIKEVGREYVLQVSGEVLERSAKNAQLPTGAIELQVHQLRVLNTAQTPPFLIEADTDGGEELRMQYRYLDLRRHPLQQHMLLRQQLCNHVRAYLTQHHFVEVETPLLIKSTPGGARDFLVPSRLHKGQYYALPQSPQVFKQLLMVAGLDRYYQLAKCFRDEDFRADRQPEFTQIDCELSFVEQEDILQIFEEFIRFIFQAVCQVDLGTFPRITYAEALQRYGTDKPDMRFGMPLIDLTPLAKETTFKPFQAADSIIALCVKDRAACSRSQLDTWSAFVKKEYPAVSSLVYVKYLLEEQYTSSVDKFYHTDELKSWAARCQASPGDLLLILAGPTAATQQALGQLRLKLRDELKLVQDKHFFPLWVVDFPLLEWDSATDTYKACHHPFTAPKQADLSRLLTDPASVRANAYDLVINGVEVGGGSIRIHERKLQEQIFSVLGMTAEEVQAQFGFLLEAFEYGAPPHGGIAFGLDRLCALIGQEDSIRPFIAFPKNNAGKDVMMKAPGPASAAQLSEMGCTFMP
jgi:aspartyl-tRNA synthetase